MKFFIFDKCTSALYVIDCLSLEGSPSPLIKLLYPSSCTSTRLSTSPARRQTKSDTFQFQSNAIFLLNYTSTRTNKILSGMRGESATSKRETKFSSDWDSSPGIKWRWHLPQDLVTYLDLLTNDQGSDLIQVMPLGKSNATPFLLQGEFVERFREWQGATTPAVSSQLTWRCYQLLRVSRVSLA